MPVGPGEIKSSLAEDFFNSIDNALNSVRREDFAHIITIEIQQTIPVNLHDEIARIYGKAGWQAVQIRSGRKNVTTGTTLLFEYPRDPKSNTDAAIRAFNQKPPQLPGAPLV